jgi:hypothetical protein
MAFPEYPQGWLTLSPLLKSSVIIAVLGMEPMASHMLGKLSITELHPQASLILAQTALSLQSVSEYLLKATVCVSVAGPPFLPPFPLIHGGHLKPLPLNSFLIPSPVLSVSFHKQLT